MPTQRQKEAVAKIVENGGIISKAMEEVGYSPNTAKTPQKLTESKGYQEAAFDYLKELEDQKQMTIQRLKEEMPQAKFGELSSHLEKVTKLIELLGGRPTERTADVNLKNISTEDLLKMIGEKKDNGLNT